MAFLKFYISQLFIALIIGGISFGVLASPTLAAELNPNNNYKSNGVYTSITDIKTSNEEANDLENIVELASNKNNKNGDDNNDPLESVNRVIFEFNEGLQDYLLRPTANFYNDNVNATVRLGIGNFLSNISSPVVLANDLLQGNIARAITTFSRLLINSTFGVLGFADVAADLGIERHKEDFGQTLGSYGIGEGFYLVLPLFGPSNPRDALGKLFVDSYFDPVGQLATKDVNWGVTGGSAIDEYSGIVDELNQVKMTSVDYYAAIRSLYRQKRKSEISNGSELELPPIPDLGYDTMPENFTQSLAGR
jgi:phospholipid-binding lipoprotein MlaA